MNMPTTREKLKEAGGGNSQRQSKWNSIIQHVDVSKRWQDGPSRRDCCPHHQVHKAKGQPVTGSVDFHSLSFISLTCSVFTSLAPPPPPSSSLGQLRQISRTHSHCAIIYSDSTLRLVFCFCTYICKNADYVFNHVFSISCRWGDVNCRSQSQGKHREWGFRSRREGTS